MKDQSGRCTDYCTAAAFGEMKESEYKWRDYNISIKAVMRVASCPMSAWE